MLNEGTPPKGTAVDLFQFIHARESRLETPRVDGHFAPVVMHDVSKNALMSAEKGYKFTLQSPDNYWEQYKDQYNGDRNAFDKAYEQASGMNAMVNYHKEILKDSVMPPDPLTQQALALGLMPTDQGSARAKVSKWDTGTLGGDTALRDNLERMLYAEGRYTDKYGAEQKVTEDTIDDKMLYFDATTDHLGRLISEPQLKEARYKEMIPRDQMLHSWNLQRNNEGWLSAAANAMASALGPSWLQLKAMANRTRYVALKNFYDITESPRTGVSWQEHINHGAGPEWWGDMMMPDEYKQIMDDLDGGYRKKMRDVENNFQVYLDRARAGDPEAQRAVDLYSLVSGIDESGDDIASKLADAYDLQMEKSLYKRSQHAEENPWSVEGISATMGDVVGQLLPQIAISALSAGALTGPGITAFLAKGASKRVIGKAFKATAAARMRMTSGALGRSGRVLNQAGQRAVGRIGSGVAALQVGGLSYQSARQAGYTNEEAIGFGMVGMLAMYSTEVALGNAHLVNAWVGAGGRDSVAKYMAKELGKDFADKNMEAKAMGWVSKWLRSTKKWGGDLIERYETTRGGALVESFLKESNQEASEEFLNAMSERYWDKNYGNSTKQFGEGEPLGQRMLAAWLVGGLAGGMVGLTMGGRAKGALHGTINRLVADGKDSDVTSVAKEWLKSGKIDQDEFNAIQQQIKFAKDAMKTLDINDPYVEKYLTGKEGLASTYISMREDMRSLKERAGEIQKELGEKENDPEFTDEQRQGLTESLEQVQEQMTELGKEMQGYENGTEVKNRIMDMEIMRAVFDGRIANNPWGQPYMIAQQVDALQDKVKQRMEFLQERRELLLAGLQERGYDESALARGVDFTQDTQKKVQSVVSGINGDKSQESQANLLEHVKKLIEKEQFMQEDLDIISNGLDQLIAERKKQFWGQKQTVQGPDGPEEVETDGSGEYDQFARRATDATFQQSANQALLEEHIKIQDLVKLKTEIEVEASKKIPMSAKHLTSPDSMMDLAARHVFTSAQFEDGSFMTVDNAYNAAQTALKMGTSIDENAQLNNVRNIASHFNMLVQGAEILSKLYPEVAGRMNMEHSAQLASENRPVNRTSTPEQKQTWNQNIPKYEKRLKEQMADPFNAAVRRLAESGELDGIRKKINDINNAVAKLMAQSDLRNEYQDAIHRARLIHRTHLTSKMMEKMGVSGKEIETLFKALEAVDINSEPRKYEQILESLEHRLHDKVKSNPGAFYKAVNDLTNSEAYKGAGNQGLSYLSGKALAVNRRPDFIDGDFILKDSSWHVEHGVGWAARIALGPRVVRQRFHDALHRVGQRGVPLPSKEQEYVIITAYSMAHAPSKSKLVDGLTPPGVKPSPGTYAADEVDSLLVSLWGSAGSGKTTMTPILAHMEALRNPSVRLVFMAPSKGNQDTMHTNNSAYGLAANAEYLGFDAFDRDSHIAKSEGSNTTVFVDESHALNDGMISQLKEAAENGGTIYVMGDHMQVPPTDLRSSSPIVSNSIRVPQLTITYRQANLPYMLFLAEVRDRAIYEGRQRVADDSRVTFSLATDTEWSPKEMEGVRIVLSRDEVVAAFVEYVQAGHQDAAFYVENEQAVQEIIAAISKLDPSIDASSMVRHLKKEPIETSGLGMEFRSVFAYIPEGVPNYARKLYTAASRGKKLAVINQSTAVSKEVETVQKSAIDTQKVHDANQRQLNEQAELVKGFGGNTSTVQAPETGGTTSQTPAQSTLADNTSETAVSPGPADPDPEAPVDNTTGPSPDPGTPDPASDGGIYPPIKPVVLDPKTSTGEEKGRGKPENWMYKSLKEGQVPIHARPMPVSLFGQYYPPGTPENMISQGVFMAYRNNLYSRLASTLGYKPKLELRFYNGEHGPEYRIHLVTDGNFKISTLADIFKKTLVGNPDLDVSINKSVNVHEDALTFLGLMPINVINQPFDQFHGGVMEEFVTKLRSQEGSLTDGQVVTHMGDLSWNGVNPGVVIPTEVNQATGENIYYGWEEFKERMEADGKTVSMPVFSDNVSFGGIIGPGWVVKIKQKGANGDHVTSTVVLRSTKLASENASDQDIKSHFDRMRKEVESLTHDPKDPRDHIEKTEAYHWVRANTSILANRQGNVIHAAMANAFAWRLGARHLVLNNDVIKNFGDAKKEILAMLDEAEQAALQGDNTIRRTYLPIKIENLNNRTAIESDRHLLMTDVEQVNQPMPIVSMSGSQASGTTGTGRSNRRGRGNGGTSSAPPIALMYDTTVASAPFVPPAQQEELVRRILGNRFVDGKLDYLPYDTQGLYGMMTGEGIAAYYDENGNIREGVLAHEAMHYVMIRLLDRKSYLRVIEEAKDRMAAEQGINRDLISERDANEYVAELYRNERPSTVDWIDRFVAFLKNILRRIGLYRTDINSLMMLVEAGSFTDAELNNELNFDSPLAMSGESPDYGYVDVAGITERDVLAGKPGSAASILMNAFGNGRLIDYASEMFVNTALEMTQHKPVDVNDLADKASHIAGSVRMDGGGLQMLKDDYVHDHRRVQRKYQDTIFFADGVNLRIDEIGGHNFMKIHDALKAGQTFTNMPDGLSAGEFVRDYIVYQIGRKWGNDGGMRVLAAMIRTNLGGVRIEEIGDTDIEEYEKQARTYERDDSQSDVFAKESIMVNALLKNRPLLIPSSSNALVGTYEEMDSDGGRVVRRVDSQMMTNVLLHAMQNVHAKVRSADVYEYADLLEEELTKVYQNNPMGEEGKHAFTALAVVFGSAHNWKGTVGLDEVDFVSYHAAMKELQYLKEQGSNNPTLLQRLDDMETTVANVVSAISSMVGINGLRHEFRPGRIREEDPTTPGAGRTQDTGSLRSRAYNHDQEERAQDSLNKSVRDFWVNRFNGQYQFKHMWGRFNITGDNKKWKDRTGYSIGRSSSGHFEVRSMGRESLVLLRSKDPLNENTNKKGFNKNDLPQEVLEADSNMQEVYVDLYQKFFAEAGYSVHPQTIRRYLYNPGYKDHNGFAKIFGMWSVMIKLGTKDIATMSNDPRFSEIANANVDLEERLAANFKVEGLKTENVGEIVNMGSVDEESADPDAKFTLEPERPLRLPSDLFNLNKGFANADANTTNRLNDLRFINAEGGRNYLFTRYAPLRAFGSPNVRLAESDQQFLREHVERFINNETLAKYVPFGKEINFKQFEYGGMRMQDRSKGSIPERMENRDVLVGTIHEFMNGLWMGNNKYRIPVSHFGSRNTILFLEMDMLASGRFAQFMKPVYENIPVEGRDEPFHSIAGYSVDMDAVASVINEQFSKFNSVRNQSVDRMMNAMSGMLEAIRSTADMETSAAINQAYNDMRASMIELGTSTEFGGEEDPTDKSTAAAIHKFFDSVKSTLSPEQYSQFVKYMIGPDSGLILGVDYMISKETTEEGVPTKLAPGAALLYNYSNVYNARNAVIWKGSNKEKRIKLLHKWFEQDVKFADKKKFINGEEVIIPGKRIESPLNRLYRQAKRAGAIIPKPLYRKIFNPGKQYTYTVTEEIKNEAGEVIGTQEREVDSGMTRAERVLYDGLRGAMYLHHMTDMWMQDSILGGLENYAPNTFSGQYDSKNLAGDIYANKAARALTVLSTGTRPLPVRGGLRKSTNVATYVDPKKKHDGGSYAAPHRMIGMQKSLGGAFSIHSNSSYKTVASENGSIMKHAEHLMTPQSYAFSPLQRELLTRAYGSNEKTQKIWAKVNDAFTQKVYGQGVNVDLAGFGEVFWEAAKEINELSHNDDEVAMTITDIFAPPTSIKTGGRGFQFTAHYSPSLQQQTEPEPIVPSMRFNTDNVVVQLNAERDLSDQRAPNPTQLLGVMGATSEGYKISKNVDALRVDWIRRKLSEMERDILQDDTVKSDVDAYEATRKFLRELTLKKVDPSNYMGQVMDLLSKSNLATNHPVTKQIIQNMFAKHLTRDVINPRMNGQMYNSVPGDDFELPVIDAEGNAVVDANGVPQVRKLKAPSPGQEGEVVLPFSYIQKILPQEMLEDAPYMTIEQVKMGLDESLRNHYAGVLEENDINNIIIDKMMKFDKLMSVVISRTPLNIPSGAFAMKVVGFVNDQANVVIVPPEVNQWSGADHDIDQWSVFQYASTGSFPDWDVDVATPGSGEMTLSQYQNKMLDHIRRYYLEADGSTLSLMSKETGTGDLNAALEAIKSDPDRWVYDSQWTNQIASLDAFANANSRMHYGKAMVGTIMTGVKTWVHLMQAKHKLDSEGRSMEIESLLPGMPVFENGMANGEFILSNLSQLANGALDDIKSLVMGQLNISPVNVPVVMGAIMSGVPLQEAVSIPLSKVMRYATRFAENDKAIVRNTMYPAGDLYKKLGSFVELKNNEWFTEDDLQDPYNNATYLRELYTIGDAVLAASPFIGLNTRELPPDSFEHRRSLAGIHKLTDKPLEKLVSGEPATEADDWKKAYPSGKAEVERLARVKDIINYQKLFDASLQDNGKRDPMLPFVHAMLETVNFADRVYQRAFFEHTPGFKNFIREVESMWQRKTMYHQDGFMALVELYRHASIQLSLEQLPRVSSHDPMKPSRVVRLNQDEFDLGTTEGQYGFIHKFSDFFIAMKNEIGSNPNHPGYQAIRGNRLLQEIGRYDSNGLLGVRNANLYRDPSARSAMSADFRQIDNIMINPENDGEWITSTHPMSQLLMLYSLVKDKLSFKVHSMSRFVPGEMMDFTQYAFDQMQFSLGNPKMYNISVLAEDGRSMRQVSLQSIMDNVLKPVTWTDRSLWNPYLSRTEQLVGLPYVSEEKAGKARYNAVRIKTDGDEEADPLANKSTSPKTLSTSLGKSPIVDTQVIMPGHDVWLQLFQGKKGIHMSWAQPRNYSPGRAHTPLGPVNITTARIDGKTGDTHITVDASELGNSKLHGFTLAPFSNVAPVTRLSDGELAYNNQEMLKLMGLPTNISDREPGDQIISVDPEVILKVLASKSFKMDPQFADFFAAVARKLMLHKSRHPLASSLRFYTNAFVDARAMSLENAAHIKDFPGFMLMESGNIYINMDMTFGKKSFMPPEYAAMMLVHEYMHTMTRSAFSYKSNVFEEPVDKQFYREVASLWDEGVTWLKEFKKTEDYKNVDDLTKGYLDYAMSNMYEFSAVLLSDPKVRDIIAKHTAVDVSVRPDDHGMSLIERLWHAVLKWLGLSKSTVETTSLISKLDLATEQALVNADGYVDTMGETAFADLLAKQDETGGSLDELRFFKAPHAKGLVGFKAPNKPSPTEPMKDIRELGNLLRPYSTKHTYEELSGEELAQIIYNRWDEIYDATDKSIRWQTMTFHMGNETNREKFIKEKVVPALKQWDSKERKQVLVNVLNSGATEEDFSKKIHGSGELSYDDRVRRKFLNKIGYDSQSFYMKYSDLANPDFAITNDTLKETIKVSDLGIQHIQGMEGYDPIVAVHRRPYGGWRVSLIDVTSMPFMASPAGQTERLFSSYVSPVSNEMLNTNITSNEEGIRAYVLGLLAAAMGTNNKIVFDRLKVMHLSRSKVKTKTVDLYDVLHSLKVMKRYTDIFDSMPANVRQVLSVNGLESVMDRHTSIDKYYSFAEEYLEINDSMPVDAKIIPDAVKAQYEDLLDAIDEYSHGTVSDRVALEDAIKFRMQYIKDYRGKKRHAGQYSMEEEYQNLAEMLRDLDKVKRRGGYQKIQENVALMAKNAHNYKDPLMQWTKRQIDNASKVVVTRTMAIENEHAKQIDKLRQAVKWHNPSLYVGAGWKIFEPLFITSKDGSVLDADDNPVEVNTGEIHWDKNDPRTKQALKEGKITEAHLEYANWFLDRIEEMHIANEAHEYYMSPKSKFWKGAKFNQEAAVEEAKKAIKENWKRGWIPLVKKGVSEAVTSGDKTSLKQAALSRLTDPLRLMDEDWQEIQDLRDRGRLSNPFRSELQRGAAKSKYGMNTRAKRLGLIPMVGSGSRYKLINPDFNKGMAKDMERILNNFLLAGNRTMLHERQSIPALQAFRAIQAERDKEKPSENANAMEKYADRHVYGRGRTHEVEGQVAKLNVERGLNTLVGINSVTRLALNVPMWAGNMMYNVGNAYRNALTNSMVSNDFFGMKEMNAAMAIVMNPSNRWNATDSKIEALLEKHHIHEMTEQDALYHWKRSKTNKSLFSSHVMHIGNWAGDRMIRKVVMVAQMMKDGSWDAYSIKGDELVYDVKKDRRFYDKNGNKKENADLIMRSIKERIIEQGLYDQKMDEPLKLGYDMEMAQTFKWIADKYVIGGMDATSQTAIDMYALGRAFIQFRRFIFDKVHNAVGGRMESDIGGKWIIETDPVTGDKLSVWQKHATVGYLGAIVELAGVVKDAMMMPKEERRALDGAAKESLARMAADLAVATALFSTFMVAAGKWGDDDDKDSYWRTENAYTKRLLYAAQDMYAYTPGFLIESTGGISPPIVQTILDTWNTFFGDDFSKDVKQMAWNIPGYSTYKSISDIIESKEKAEQARSKQRAELY